MAHVSDNSKGTQDESLVVLVHVMSVSMLTEGLTSLLTLILDVGICVSIEEFMPEVSNSFML